MEKPKVFIERAAPLTKEGIRAVCGTEREYKIYCKRLMTRVAKGEISEKEAQDLIKTEKTPQDKPVKEKSSKQGDNQQKTIKSGQRDADKAGDLAKPSSRTNTHKRKKSSKSREEK